MAAFYLAPVAPNVRAQHAPSRYNVPMRRGAPERLAAWAVTGPPGHFWSLVADVTAAFARYGLWRARTLRGAGSPPSSRR